MKVLWHWSQNAFDVWAWNQIVNPFLVKDVDVADDWSHAPAGAVEVQALRVEQVAHNDELVDVEDGEADDVSDRGSESNDKI